MTRCDYCNKPYTKKTHNQRYCNSECTRLATNERIMERYYERKDNRRGKSRVCRYQGCVTKLSRYNDDKYCSIHSSTDGITSKQLLSSLGISI